MKNEEKWMANYEAVKSHVAETGHFPDKHSIGNNWCRYQRKRLKAGLMTEKQKQLFEELAASRSDSHTGGRKKMITNETETNYGTSKTANVRD